MKLSYLTKLVWPNWFYPFLFGILFFSSCARTPLQTRDRAVRLVSSAPRIEDHLSRESFLEVIAKTLNIFEANGAVNLESLDFAGRKISRAAYQSSLKFLETEVKSGVDLNEFLQKNFDFYEVYGGDDWGKVLVTGYYSPLLQGSKTPSEKFSQPLYAPPKEMVTVDLESFLPRLPALQAVFKENLGKWPTVRGLITTGKNGSKTIVPVYDRAQIDEGGAKGALAGRGLEIAYVDPIDAFFLQIQGSGTVQFSNGTRTRYGYAAQNGASYIALGKFLKRVIPPEKISMQTIRAYLQTLKRADLKALLDQNPSYVFFKELTGEPLTYSGAETTAGRTIATDKRFFPKGILAYLEVDTPVFAEENVIEPKSYEAKSRLVIDQDTGGAILGGGHIDLYFGEGNLAAASAGVMKNPGRLWFLVPKVALVERLGAGEIAR